MRPRLLDLYCGAGGAAKGYDCAGFEVVGVDIQSQPNYPFEFHRADALDALVDYIEEGDGSFHVVHASPPCQHDSDCQRIQGREHPDLIEVTRELLERTGLPYVIENVEGARDKLRDPKMLCAEMFGRGPTNDTPGLDRHRYFETNWPLTVPLHPQHTWRTTKMGRPPKAGEAMHVVGNFSGVAIARGLMDMPWANRDGLREAIPPYYTEYIGRQLMAALERERVAA